MGGYTYIDNDINRIPLGLKLHAARAENGLVLLVGVLERTVFRFFAKTPGLKLGAAYKLTKTGLANYDDVVVETPPKAKVVKISPLSSIYPFRRST